MTYAERLAITIDFLEEFSGNLEAVNEEADHATDNILRCLRRMPADEPALAPLAGTLEELLEDLRRHSPRISKVEIDAQSEAERDTWDCER